jgi:Plavaka transposase
MLESLRPGMTVPEVVRFPDGHYRKVVYGLGPYIGDYPEQALLACVVQGWCAKYVSFFIRLDTHRHVFSESDVLPQPVDLTLGRTCAALSHILNY